VYREKSKFVRKKRKMMLSLNLELNGPAINLLVSRDEATLGPSQRRTMSRSGFDLEKYRLKGRGIRSKTGKSRLPFAWNPLGFPVIVALIKGRAFNAEYYRDNILEALTQLQPEDDGRKFVVHAGNARAHTAQKSRTFCEENGLRLAPNPPYSPDLILSDFLVFGYVKERLKGMVFPSYEELLDAVGEVVTGIESEPLTAVFEHWI
jgi:transposase